MANAEDQNPTAETPGTPETNAAAAPKANARKLDIMSVAGLIVAFGGILGGMMLEGGKIREVTQYTAAMIVFGGAIGATLISTPLRVLKNGLSKISLVFFEPVYSPAAAIEQMVAYATKARRNGIVSLESDIEIITDPFLKKALMLAIDGSEVKEIRSTMELELALEGRMVEDGIKVFTTAAGYAPTIGIIGAVLGLMQVMKNLENISEVGRGIATAFVATIYGLVFANIILLPTASKLKANYQASRQMKELALMGTIEIAEGMNPKLIQGKLEAFVSHWETGNKKKAKADDEEQEQESQAEAAEA